jgi:hypothetical protein
MQNDIIIDLKNSDYLLINNGFYGGVFRDVKNNQAIKVFKKTYSDEYIKFEGDANIYGQNDIQLKVFENEVSAYKKIQSNQNGLENYTPKYYGIMKISKIINEQDIDISNEYMLDLNYVMEYLRGNCDKWASINFNKKSHIKTLFEKLGIYYLIDSSVFINNEDIKIIDFAEKRYEKGYNKSDLL